MPTFVSTALTSDTDPQTVQRCLEDVHVAETLIPGVRVTNTRMRTENTDVEVFGIEAQTALFTGTHKVTTQTHFRKGDEVVVDFSAYRSLIQLDAPQAYVGSFALKKREGIGTVVSLAVDVPGIEEADPRVQGTVDDAMRNLDTVLAGTPQKHHWI